MSFWDKLVEETAKRLARVEEKALCPVCNGCGAVPKGFYPSHHIGRFMMCSTSPFQIVTDETHEECRACNGKGLITNNILPG